MNQIFIPISRVALCHAGFSSNTEPGWPRAMSCHVMASRAMPGHIFACHAIFLRVMPCHDHSVPCRVRIFLEKMTPVFEKISKIYAHGAFFWLLYAPGAGWVGSIIDQIHQGK